MTRYATLCAALLLAAPAAAQDQVQPAESAPAAHEPETGLIDPQSDPAEFDLARKKVADCEGEKFVFAWGAGARPTKVTLCSKKDATADELVQMLDDAAAKLEQSNIAEDRRIAIVQQIRAKIAEVKGAPAAAPALAAQVPAAVAQAPVTAPKPAAQPAIAPVVSQTPVPVTRPSVLATKPRLKFECYTPGEIGAGGPCITLGRETRLTVRADEPLTGATSLRFVRNGEARAEVALALMRKGQSVRLVLPRAVCAGVVETETQIQVVRGGQVVDSLGPYLLRC